MLWVGRDLERSSDKIVYYWRISAIVMYTTQFFHKFMTLNKTSKTVIQRKHAHMKLRRVVSMCKSIISYSLRKWKSKY